MEATRILLATRKGLIVFERGASGWELAGEHFFAARISYATLDPRTETLWACLDHGHWGTKLQREHRAGEHVVLREPELQIALDDVYNCVAWRRGVAGLGEPPRAAAASIARRSHALARRVPPAALCPRSSRAPLQTHTSPRSHVAPRRDPGASDRSGKPAHVLGGRHDALCGPRAGARHATARAASPASATHATRERREGDTGGRAHCAISAAPLRLCCTAMSW